MKSKLSKFKSSLVKKMEKLSDEDLSFVTGGVAALDAAAGSSGSGSGSGCDAVVVHCCYPDIAKECH